MSLVCDLMQYRLHRYRPVVHADRFMWCGDDAITSLMRLKGPTQGALNLHPGACRSGQHLIVLEEQGSLLLVAVSSAGACCGTNCLPRDTSQNALTFPLLAHLCRCMWTVLQLATFEAVSTPLRSAAGEPVAALRRQLDLLHGQITLIVTNAIDRLFARNPRYDGSNLLGALMPSSALRIISKPHPAVSVSPIIAGPGPA